ncbi:hypothetical protein [Kineosporia sp. A_224]|uniref:hypothetical protein n=1 Tax=Kineosporia sp. A_224 TaxID=1962180 RepID=UPI000B4AD986|nr:hypothetical protein [Kineosporia sp. A_224]
MIGAATALMLGGSQSVDPATVLTHSSSHRVKVSGSAKGLLPGGTVHLDAKIRNRSSKPLLVDALTVTVVKVDKKHRACALENYEPVAYSGPLPLVVPPRKTRKLSQLHIPLAQRPGVTMPDRPWPQNACLGAKLTVTYTGTARIQSGGDGHGHHDDDDDDHDDHHHR